jgi:cytochrome c biogenesis protein
MARAKDSNHPAKAAGKKSKHESAVGLASAAPLAEVAVTAGGAEVAPEKAVLRRQKVSIIDRLLGLLSAVPFGITLLALLITACMIGMLIQQQDLETFAKYYAELTPAEKLVYGRLGFFNIYHIWYFNLLLLLLSLNIILASIDHFPAALSYFRRKKLTASPTFAQTQRIRVEPVELRGASRAELADRASAAARALGFKVKVTEEETRTTVFAEKGLWNRMGAYAVHVSLLTIFLGGFLTSTRGHTGAMWLEPGRAENVMQQQVFNVDHASNDYAIAQQQLQLPFQVEALDIQQKLIDKNQGIDNGNTLDWLTRVKIHDERGSHDALIHMNKPYDYRSSFFGGYRFFQASFLGRVGNARTITLRVTSEGSSPEEITIKRNGEGKLADGTRLRYLDFNSDFQIGPDKQPIQPMSADYSNPAARLEVIRPNGERRQAWAFTEAFLGQITGAPVMKAAVEEAMGGFRFVLTDFEKVSEAHMLSIQYDPGVNIVYLGFTMLCGCLMAVFFFSHQRLWIVVEGEKVYLGGDANRNRLGFEDRVKQIAARIGNHS